MLILAAAAGEGGVAEPDLGRGQLPGSRTVQPAAPCPLPRRAAAQRPGRPRVWPVSTRQRAWRGRPQTAGWATRGRKEGGGGGAQGTSCLRRAPQTAPCASRPDGAPSQQRGARAGAGSRGRGRGRKQTHARARLRPPGARPRRGWRDASAQPEPRGQRGGATIGQTARAPEGLAGAGPRGAAGFVPSSPPPPPPPSLSPGRPETAAASAGSRVSAVTWAGRGPGDVRGCV